MRVAAIGLLLLIPTLATAQPDPQELTNAMQAARLAGDYATALVHARELRELRDTTEASVGQRADARTWVDALEAIVELPRAAQDSLAVADQLQGQIRSAFRDGDTATAARVARRQLDLRRAALPPPHHDLVSSLAWLSLVLRNRGQYGEAEAASREALRQQLDLHGREHVDTATAINGLADLLRERGDLVGAEVLLREALQLRRRLYGDDDFVLAGSHNNLALLLGGQGRYADAETHYRRSLDLVRRHRGERDRLAATSLRNLATTLQAQERWDEADATLHEALSIYDELDHDWGRSRCHRLLGGSALARGDAPAAVELLDRSLVLLRELHGEEHDYVAGTRLLRADALARSDRLDEALAEVQSASEVLDRLLGPNHPHTVGSQIQLARLRWTRGEPDLALALLDRAMDGYEAARLRAAADWKRATARVDSPYPLRAAVLLDLDRPGDAWDAAERGRARVLTELLDRTGAHPLDLASARREQALRLRLTAAESRLRAVRRAGGDLEAARDDLLDVELEWSRWHKERSDRVEAGRAPVATLADIRSRLGEGEALLGWLEVDDARSRTRRWASVLTSEGVAFVPLPHDPGPVEELGARLAGARRSALGLPLTAQFQGLADAVREAWLTPVWERFPGVRAWTVVPSGALLSIPVEALGTGGAAEVRYAPSAALALQDSREGSADRAFFLGDPPFEPAFSPLPHTRREIETAAATFKETEILLGPDASESQLWAMVEEGRLRSFDVLHFATHAIPDHEHPEASALILATESVDSFDAVVAGRPFMDGRVTAGEILASWDLDADLVTLSACGTGLGRKVAGEGTLGLAHAFLNAGARSLLVSLWDVDDEATSLFMQRFYGNRRTMGKTAALREARTWLADQTDDAGRRPFAHPHFWSAFVLLGGGS